MAIGRISGPLLAQNLLRNGVDLAFETDLLYLDVTNGRIGIKESAPKAELDVNGDIIAHKITVNTATIGLTTITSSETSSTISTLLGPLNVVAGVNDLINLYSNVELYGSLHATGNITADGNIVLGDTTSSDTLIVEAEIKSDLLPSLSTGTGTSLTTGTVISPYSIGSTSSFWLKGYFDTLVTNKIAPGTGTDITVFPNPIQNLDGSAKNLFTINGDIRVYGGNPIGTAPVVSNVLYVTMDGDDNNDGRAEDSSRACRTVSGAVKSPFYKEGTIIKVRSGHYYEDNPIELLPYTAVVGDDLRTTFLEPINKDIDIFWVNSGVYIAQMAFLNLRKGSVTRYAPGGIGEYETGAYCVAFPPSLDNPIDVYHSPYIQNCTNQSGPWMYDGTMFVPNHTVQVPRVWGTGTYQANTTTVIFHKNTACVEMIQLGDTINGSGILMDPAVPNAVVTHISRPDTLYLRAQTLLEKNKPFIQAEVIGYLSSQFPNVVYDANTCKRDVGLVVDAITYDAILGGNSKSVIAGVSYYNGNSLVIKSTETTATIAAFQYVNTLAQKVLTNSAPNTSYQNNVYQYIDTNLYGAEVAGPAVTARVNDIVDIIQHWAGIENASALISANRSFIQTEVIAFLDDQYTSLNYDRGICYRDIGLIVDAVQYDLLHKSNVQSIIAAESYWEGVTSIIAGEQYETAAAIQYARDLTSNIVSNITATTYQSTVTQVITPSLSGGVLALPSLQSNYNMIATVVTSGTNYLPLSTNSTLTEFLLTLSTVTVGISTTGSVYIGDTYVYPVLEKDIPNRWDGGNAAEGDRRIDPHGSGGGALVDGNAPSTRSPIQSFVFDAFTQITQGGHGVHIINNGYAQLVSVFTIFNDIAVHCESGGIASITNSNSNFGDLCLVAEGFGKKEFNGTIYNAPFVAYDPNSNTLSDDENYPLGYFPRYQEVAVFIPDSKNRPHISLVMEVVPPDYIIDYEDQTVPYRNEQGFEGFLAAISNTSTLVQGSLTLTGIDTTGIAVGHTLNIRNQYGETSYQGIEYISSGTVVTHVGYKTVTLNKPIQKGDPGERFNQNYFNLYFSGNAYYTILSSILGPSPIPPGQNKIRGQEVETVAAINYLKSIAGRVVSNLAVTATYQTTIGQIIDPAYSGGSSSVPFINSELDAVTGIILQGPSATPIVKTTGTYIAGSTSAIALLTKNRKFLASEVLAFTTSTYQNFQFNNLKCYRDVQLMVDAVCEDLLTGGNFKACEAGNTYYSKDGTYHIVTIEEGVTNPLLFPDGCKVNFYQRSYMSASGYLFEYVGAGTDYGALPQVGRVDPVQSKEVVQVNNGKVFFTSTDQNGDYRIGPGLVISQATGVLSGRTFQKSLFAEMTPFILAVEAGSEV
jgi:hypothetical protein